MSLEKEAYEQNYLQFRSLNQIMWQIPVLAMTLTGGLWFAVSRADSESLVAPMLLLTAVVGNLALVVVLRRFRFVMGKYLDWLKKSYPSGFVDASSPDDDMNPVQRFFVSNERVRQTFSLLLFWAAGVSAVLFGVQVWAEMNKESKMDNNPGIAFYEQHAAALADSYEAVSFADAYPFLVPVFSGNHLQVLDIGAGTGRDAAWIAERGHRVYAVEPSAAMRTVARSLHPDRRITWIDARLPSLEAPPIQPEAFEIVLANAVWMHIAPEDRGRSLARMYEVTAPGGSVYVSLRIGPQDARRGMFEVSADSFVALAQAAGYDTIHHGEFPDLLGRPSVSWSMYQLQKPL
ncbi:class I SAM-dependent methyltransferase [Aquamicrobium segne]|uniref:Class I SAM-dependent methyltransferase n=1 Tax=Aquamicrobium segne TaxID=469547 RepID=A0ABW0GZG3_9HYPH